MALLIILNLFFQPQVSFADTCSDWFSSLKIASTGNNCISICNTSLVDMSTFSCHNECAHLCKIKKIKKCSLDKTILKFNILPAKWPWPKDTLLVLDQEEINRLESALSRIPSKLISSIDGIYFIEKPKDLFSLGTQTSYNENHIIIYRKAFEEPSLLINKIVHELGHHLHETIEKKSFHNYQKIFNQKDRAYLTIDSKFSPEEDFATNFEFYITDPNEIKKKLPKIFNWFQEKFDNKYNLQECK